VILASYRAEVAREQPQTSLAPGRYPSFAEGVEIAWQAYSREVISQGRDPDRARFDKMMGVLR
jgi:hypothetical protein